MPYTISDEDYANIVTQAGYVKDTLTSIENAHPSYNLAGLHLSLNHLALIGALAVGAASTTFGGSGTVTSTTPQSGGTQKGGG